MKTLGHSFRSFCKKNGFNALGYGAIVVSILLFAYFQMRKPAESEPTEQSELLKDMTPESDGGLDVQHGLGTLISDDQKAAVGKPGKRDSSDQTTTSRDPTGTVDESSEHVDETKSRPVDEIPRTTADAKQGEMGQRDQHAAEEAPSQQTGDPATQTQNISSGMGLPGGRPGGTSDSKKSYTLEEFAKKVPLVAGKMKAQLLPGSGDVKDPIVEVHFMSFFPNNSMSQGGKSAVPSMSLFAAKRKSGRIERTRVINDYRVAQRLSSNKAIDPAEAAGLFMPLTTCSAIKQDKNLDVLLTFMGLGEEKDFHVQMNCGSKVSGKMMVDNENEVNAQYNLEPIDYTADGHQAMNFVVAGINPRRDENVRWLEIGKRPKLGIVNVINPVDSGQWASRWIIQRNPQLYDMIVKENERAKKAFLEVLEGRELGELMASDTTSPKQFEDEKPDNARIAHPLDNNSGKILGNSGRSLLSKRKADPAKFQMPMKKEEDTNWEDMFLSRVLKTWDEASF